MPYKHPNVAEAAHLIALHFYLAGTPITLNTTSHQAESLQQSEIEPEEKGANILNGNLVFLQELTPTAPWLYREDPHKKDETAGFEERSITGWLFLRVGSFDTVGLVCEDSSEKPPLATSDLRKAMERFVENGIEKLLSSLSWEANRRGFSSTYIFNINFPLPPSVPRPISLPDSSNIVEPVLQYLRSRPEIASPRDGLVVNTYRVMHQLIAPTASNQARHHSKQANESLDTEPSISIRVIFPHVQSNKVRNFDIPPEQLSQTEPSLFSRGEVVFGIFVSSVFAGYASLLGPKPNTTSSKTSIQQQSQEHTSSWPKKNCLYISLLYINKQYRRMGLGRQLLEFILESTRVRDVIELAWRAASDDDKTESFGYEKEVEKEVDSEENHNAENLRLDGIDVWVTVDADNIAAGALYESVGFVEIGRNGSVKGEYSLESSV